MPKPTAAFVDRDGTLIRESGYLSRPEQIEILPRVGEAISMLRSCGLKVVMVTNQSAVARGLLNEQELREIHIEIEKRLSRSGASLDGIFYCPHHPTEGMAPYRVACECRKPNPGLIQRACAELGLESAGSYVVGDQWGDMVLANNVGAKGLLIDRALSNATGKYPEGNGGPAIWATVPDFWSAAQRIIRELKAGLIPSTTQARS